MCSDVNHNSRIHVKFWYLGSSTNPKLCSYLFKWQWLLASSATDFIVTVSYWVTLDTQFCWCGSWNEELLMLIAGFPVFQVFYTPPVPYSPHSSIINFTGRLSSISRASDPSLPLCQPVPWEPTLNLLAAVAIMSESGHEKLQLTVKTIMVEF
jgi:hypothetical protein